MSKADIGMPETTDKHPRIHFEDSGSGIPVVLGHSFLCSGAMWREQVRGLEDRCRLVNVDFRGHGRSGPALEPFSLYDAVDDVVRVLDRLGIEKAVWCGLSIGGMVAMRAALAAPERVSGLVIMDSDAGREKWLRRLRYRLMAAAVRRVGVRPLLKPVSKMMFGKTTLSAKRDLVDEWCGRFETVDVPSMLTCLDALIRRDSVLGRLPGVGVPSLVIVGSEDLSLPARRSLRIHGALPDSEFVEVPEAGHLSALEQPALVNAAIARFLEQHESDLEPGRR